MQHIEGVVVERGHHLRLGRLAIGHGKLQSPLFLSARDESVAEGGPMGVQTTKRLRLGYPLRPSVELSVLHPCTGKGHSITINLTIGKREGDDGIAEQHRSA